MPPLRSRYVTACQQVLALGVVLVALAPATQVISLDVVSGPDGQSQPLHVGAHAAAYSRVGARSPVSGHARQVFSRRASAFDMAGYC